ncbi:hypothetical protein H0H92_006375 [Tricholoma furcatifolium]|nr:hypothetical protein H0H92_006375 [Tricholoma furcatifolium]
MCLRSRTRRSRKQSVYPSEGSSGVPEAHQLSGLAGTPPPSHVGQQQLPHGVPHRTSSVAEAPYQQPEPDRSSTVGKLEQLPPVAEGLPSQVDETLAGCPRFRILVVGKVKILIWKLSVQPYSGIGKSSLVKNIFNVDPDKIDISDHRAGEADIYREYMSRQVNRRFVLHDSRGFEHGSNDNFTKVENFLQLRQQGALPERIHAIWLCIETPLTGSRLLQTGDDELLKLAKKLNIPIIAVFTKYDDLVKQFLREETATSRTREEKLLNAEQKASESFSRSVKQLDSQTMSLAELSIPSVKVSVEPEFNKDLHILNLTNVTRERLQDIEDELKVLWVAAQQVNARQKVDVSIRYSPYSPNIPE